MDYQSLLELALDVAEKAAIKIMAVYSESDFDVEMKSDNTPLTRADLIAHHSILEALQKVIPEFPILSEESTDIDWAVRKKWQTYWLIDPLDGTKEFVERNDEFTVNIALIQNGKPVVGVVVAPALNLSYFAAKGFGAYKKFDGQQATSINVRPVPEDNGHKHFTLMIGRRSHSQRLEAVYAKAKHFEKVLLGSSLKICRIAEGNADLYPRFGKISEWDTAAAQCVLEEAGGYVTDLTLQPLKYNTKESLLNPDLMAWSDESIPWLNYVT